MSLNSFNFSVTWIDGGPCPGRFHCAESSCLDWSKVCDETDDCPGGEDEISCPSGCESLRDRKVAEGQLSSLYHPRYYPDNLRCLWRIKAESNQLIQLKFNFFNTEENVDLLKVFNGFGREKRLSGWFSGTRTPTVFRSRYHQITLQFTSDQSVNRPGFNISYKMDLPKNLPACGGNQTIPVPLGMESGKIRNRQITSSSVLTGHWAAHNARLRNSRSAWASSVTQPKRLQWLQIDFEKASLLTGVAVQGFRAGRDFYVTSFVIHYSVDGKNWVKYTSRLSLNAKVFSGNNGSFSIKHHDFDHPFVTRFLRIIPRTWVGSCTVLRTEVYGCEDLGQLKPSQQGCSESNFECSDGSCILREAYCDGVIDCDDGSDERRCSGCRWNEIECFSGECVPSAARCDGNRDCRDGSDEFQCSSCGEDDFLCADESACISRKWRCDGFKDCLDMSDEQGCGHGWLCNVSSNFRCNDGGCVSGINVMCNDVAECQDHSDEALCDCGIKDPRDEAKSNNTRLNQELVHRVPRIVGGTASEPHSWPWQVSLRRSVGGAHFCGATLVGREWLVTAAHCLVGVTRENVKAKVGLHYRVSDSQPTRDMDVKEIYMHPRYDDQTYDFDVALLRLKTPVTFSDEISPICVPPFTHMFHPDQKCWITGWGSSYKDGPGSDLLQEVEVTIMTSLICNRPMWYAGKITHRMFCAGHITGKADSCQGDSGGPLACQERGNGRWFLAGIVSWGSGCGNLFKPGVYTKVTEVSHWLKEIMSEDST
ncbi:unnamed protein product [Clavelina lepadiformis]|uniref:Uncharacterized protein n=1 Tax=Clavelina lepadiformis TaxID=159417 RepID=A0ABP0G418_CLALP